MLGGQPAPIGQAITETRQGPGRAQAHHHPDRPALHHRRSAARLPGHRHDADPAGPRLRDPGDPALTGMSRDDLRHADRAAVAHRRPPRPSDATTAARRAPPARHPRRHLPREDHRRRTRPAHHPRPAQDSAPGTSVAELFRRQPAHHRQRHRESPPAPGTRRTTSPAGARPATPARPRSSLPADDSEPATPNTTLILYGFSGPGSAARKRRAASRRSRRPGRGGRRR